MFPQTVRAAEQINSFNVSIEVKEDGTIEVEEQIKYQFSGQRHGISRDLPLTYDDGQLKWLIPITIHSVTNDQGVSWPYEQQQSSPHSLRLKIGDPDRTITDEQTYIIRYRADGALRYFDDHDELYWNVTGTEWEVPILKSSAQVILPDNIFVTGVRCFVGLHGSTSEDCRTSGLAGVAEFSANGPLTVVVGWPPDMVAELLPPRYVNWQWPLPFLLPLIALMVMYRLWKRHGRDAPVSPTLVVQYDPPDKMPPAEMGTVMDGRADMRDITASIVDLAVRGYLKIEETTKKGFLFDSKDHQLILRKKDFRGDPTLKSYEVTILKTFFDLGDKVRLSYVKDKYLFQHVMKKIKRQLGDQAVLDGYYASNPMKARAKWMAPVMILMFATWLAAPLMMAIPVFFGLSLITSAAAWFLSLIIVGIFGWFMPKMTPKGAMAYSHAKGFQEYITRAEKYRIQWQEKENIFEKFLPYAMVFKVSEKWTKAFEGVDMQQPDWYEGSAFRAGYFNAVIFTSSFDSFSKSMKTAVTSRPSQSGGGSGFGGGGFSGGGGGGGGGGSW